MQIKQKFNWLSLLSIGMLVFVAIGCSSLSGLSSGNSNVFQSNIFQSNTTSPASKNGKDVENSLRGKSNLYIKSCVNAYSDSVSSNFDDYKKWVKDLEKGPTGKETNIYDGSQISNDGQDCVDAINQAKELNPDLPDVEAHAEAYGAALKEVVARSNEIYPYYNREDYKDDKFARAKEAHPALLKAYRDFEAADKTFQTDIDKLEDEVAQGDLKEFGNDPENRFQYLMVDTGIKAKKILKEVDRQSFNELSAEALQPLVDDFGKSVDELKIVKETSKNQTNISVSMYPRSCEEFLKSSKELTRHIRDKTPFTRNELMMGNLTTGTPQNLVSKYNEMIRYRNF